MLEYTVVASPFGAFLSGIPIIRGDAVIVDGVEQVRTYGDTLMGFLRTIATRLLCHAFVSPCCSRNRESTDRYCERKTG